MPIYEPSVGQLPHSLAALNTAVGAGEDRKEAEGRHRGWGEKEEADKKEKGEEEEGSAAVSSHQPPVTLRPSKQPSDTSE